MRGGSEKTIQAKGAHVGEGQKGEREAGEQGDTAHARYSVQGTSLGVQRVRLLLPMQGLWVRSLARSKIPHASQPKNQSIKTEAILQQVQQRLKNWSTSKYLETMKQTHPSTPNLGTIHCQHPSVFPGPLSSVLSSCWGRKHEIHSAL